MPEIIVMIGVSGSGKTTWVTELINRDSSYVRVNRDNIREGLVGKLDQSYYSNKNLKSLEKQVTYIVNWETRHLLQQGFNVILDATHLKRVYVDEIIDDFQHLADIRLKFIDTSLETCRKRVFKREDKRDWWDRIWTSFSMDLSYIDRQYKDFTNIQVYYWGKDTFYPQINSKVYNDKDKVNTIISDLDGTLCLYGDKNPYDRDFENDTLNIAVYTVLRNWLDANKDKVIIFFSGRNDKFRKQTEIFLTKYFDTDEYVLYMRKDKDMRKDTIIKLEMYNNHIASDYHVEFIIDDRLQVVRLWDKLGLPVLNVNSEMKEF